jgi:hypothetical protein
MKMVVPEVRLATAFSSSGTVETLTMVPEGGGSGAQVSIEGKEFPASARNRRANLYFNVLSFGRSGLIASDRSDYLSS